MNEVQKLFLYSKKQQKEISEILQIDEATLSRYKTGKTKITLERLKEWCEILKIDIKLLFNSNPGETHNGEAEKKL